MSRKENMLAYLEDAKKDKKNKLKIGTLDTFNVGGLDSTIPTLHLPYDDLFGGFQKGVIAEYYGEESSGKSSTLGKIIENMVYFKTEQEAELSILYVDSEGK